MFALVLLFGLFHGLIFLPVLLSLIGPQNSKKSKRGNDDIDGNRNVKTNSHDNHAFKTMENGLTSHSMNGPNSKITPL